MNEDTRTADPGGLREPTESDPIETFAHPWRAPVVIDGHEYRHTSDCEWPALTPEATAPGLDPALLGDDPDDPEDVAWLAHHSVPAPEATAPTQPYPFCGSCHTPGHYAGDGKHPCPPGATAPCPECGRSDEHAAPCKAATRARTADPGGLRLSTVDFAMGEAGVAAAKRDRVLTTLRAALPEATAPDRTAEYERGWHAAFAASGLDAIERPPYVRYTGRAVKRREAYIEGWVDAIAAVRALTPEATAPDQTADPGGLLDRLMELWQQPWSEPAYGEAQMLLSRLRALTPEATAPDARE